MWRFNDNLRTHLDERFVMERIWLEERLDLNQTNLSRRLSQKMALMKAEWRKEERMRREQEEKTRPGGNVDALKDILEKVKQMEEKMMKKEETLDQKLLEVSEALRQQKEGYNLLQEEFEKIKIEREEMSARKLEIDRENESLREQQEKLVAEEKNQLMKVIQQKEELVHQWEKFALERQKLEEIKREREQKQKEMEIRIMEAVKNEELAKQRAEALELEKNMEIERMKIEMEKEAIKKEKEREQALQALRQTLEMKEQKKKITREEKERKRKMEEEWRTIEGEKKIIGEEWNAIENEKKKLIKQKKDVEKSIERSKKDIAYQDNEKRPKKIPKENLAEEKTQLEKRTGKDDQVTSQSLMETEMAFENKWWEKKENEVAEWQAAEKKMTKDQKRAEVGTAPALMESESKKMEKSMADKKKKKREETLVRERLDTKIEMDSEEDLFKTKKETVSLLTCNSLKPPPTPPPTSAKTGQGPALCIRNKAKTDKLRFNFGKNNLKEADIKPTEAKVVSQNVLITPKRTKEVDPHEEFDRELDALLDSETEKDGEKDLYKTKNGTAPLPTCSPLPTCNPFPAWTKTEQGSERHIQNKADTDQHRFNLGKNNLKEVDIKPTETKFVSQNVLISPKRTKEVDPRDEFDRELDALLDSKTEKDGEKDLYKTKKETAPLPTCKPDGEKDLFKTTGDMTCSPPPACTKTNQKSGLRLQKKDDTYKLMFNFGKNNLKEADIKPEETKFVGQNVLITPKRTKEVDPREEFDRELDALLDSETEKDGGKDLYKTKEETAPVPTCTKTEQGPAVCIQNKADTDQHRFNFGKNNLKLADIKPKEAKAVSHVLITPKRTKEVDPREEFDRELDALLDSETEKDGEKDLYKTKNGTAPLPSCSPLPTCNPLPAWTKTEQGSECHIQIKADTDQHRFNLGKNNLKEADIKPKETNVVAKNVLITPKRKKEVDPREEFDRELYALLDSETEKDGEKDLYKTKKDTVPLATCKPDGEKDLFKTTGDTTCSPPPACTKTNQKSGRRLQKKDDTYKLMFNFGKNNLKEADIKPKETKFVGQNVLITPKRTKEVDPREEFDRELDALLDSETEKDGGKDLYKTKEETAPVPTCTKTEQGPAVCIQNKADTDQHRFNFGKNNLKQADIKPKEAKVVSQNVLITPKRTKEVDPREKFDRELDALLDSL